MNLHLSIGLLLFIYFCNYFFFFGPNCCDSLLCVVNFKRHIAILCLAFRPVRYFVIFEFYCIVIYLSFLTVYCYCSCFCVIPICKIND